MTHPTIPFQEEQTAFVQLSLAYLARRYNISSAHPEQVSHVQPSYK
jgi:hypothetical protein